MHINYTLSVLETCFLRVCKLYSVDWKEWSPNLFSVWSFALCHPTCLILLSEQQTNSKVCSSLLPSRFAISTCFLRNPFVPVFQALVSCWTEVGFTPHAAHILRPYLLRVLVNNQLGAQFLLWYVYLNPLHVSSNCVLIFRRTIVLIQHLV